MSGTTQIVERLRGIPLFADFRDNTVALQKIAAICTTERAPAGRVVIREGETGSSMYIVNTGAVEIHKRTRAGDEYTVVQLNAADNVFFGELALIDDDRRSATVITTRDSEFLVIAKEQFLALGDQQPAIGLPVTRAIARIIAGRLRKTTADMLTIFDALVEEVQGG